MTTKSRPLSWKPHRRGAIFCSPACGFQCTVSAHEKAKKSASDLVKKMGPGWQARVWENLGWHWNAVSKNGYLKIHPSSGEGYTAFLGEKGGGGKWAQHGRTPQEAIAAVVLQAREELSLIERLLTGL